MSILQTTVVWGGFNGAPGYTNLFTTNAGLITTAVDNSVAGVAALFNALKPLMATQQTFNISNEVKELDEATGDLVAVHSPGSAPGTIVGTMNPNLGPIAVGTCIAWGTGGVHHARRVRGRTFLVPMCATVFQSDGTIVDAHLATINAAATAYRTSSAYETLVWARPVKDKVTHAVTRPGAAFPILTSSVRDRGAVLRSRRD